MNRSSSLGLLAALLGLLIGWVLRAIVCQKKIAG